MSDFKPHGNYDAEAVRMMIELQAPAVALIVIGGVKGHGFSVAGIDTKSDPYNICEKLPDILRNIATHIEQDIKARKKQ